MKSFRNHNRFRSHRWPPRSASGEQLVGADLCALTLDDAHARGGRKNLSQLETGLLEESPEFRFGSLSTSCDDQHVHIVGCGAATLQRLVDSHGVDALDDQQLAMRWHRSPTIVQDYTRTLVVPIVDHVLEQVGIGSGWNLLEEAPTNHLASIRHPRALDLLFRALGDVGLVEDGSSQSGICLQNPDQEGAASATDVDDPPEGGEVVCRGDRSR